MIPRFFIDRPIFATVLSAVVTLAGALAVRTLPIAQYPQITPPTVQVDCNFPGADSQTVSDTIASPIEQQVNGVEDMLYMASQCTNEGSYTLTVTAVSGVGTFHCCASSCIFFLLQSERTSLGSSLGKANHWAS